METYNFNKSPVAVDRLTKEIKDSIITIALDHINVFGVSVDVVFKAPLSSDEIATLTSLITAHAGQPLIENVPQQVQVMSDANQKDSENAGIVRLKMAPTGWTYKLRGIEMETSKVGGVESKDLDGTDRTDLTSYHYNANGDLLSPTNPTAIDDTCVKTVLDWEPPHDYELIGGTVKILVSSTLDVHFWVVAVPDVPYAYGGSRVMVDGVNFKYVDSADKVQADGRVSKRLIYSSIYHSNKLRFVFKHEPGANHKFMIMLEFFKP